MLENLIVNKNLRKSTETSLNLRTFNIHMIPVYKEELINLSSLIITKSIFFNMINLPIRVIVMSISKVFGMLKNDESKLLFYYLIKASILLIGYFSLNLLEKSMLFEIIDSNIRSIKGLKLFSFMKIFEYLCLLGNRYNEHIDIELVNITYSVSYRIAMLTYIYVLLGFILNLIAIYSILVAYDCLFYSYSNIIYLLFFKLNYIELKRQGKKQSKKKITRLVIQDIYDRWLNFFCILYTSLNGLLNGKINYNNGDYYFYITFYLFLTEIVSKWIKDTMLIKVSGSGESADIIKLITKEMLILHQKLKFQYVKEDKSEYINYLQSYKFELVTLDNLNYTQNYIGIIDYQNLILVDLEFGCLVYIIYFFKHQLFTIMFNYIISYNILISFSLLCSIILICIVITDIICNYIERLIEKQVKQHLIIKNK